MSVHFRLQIFSLLEWFVHFVDLYCIRPFWTLNFHPLGMIRPLCGPVLCPSILDFKFSSFWDDLSTFWTCFVSVHFGLQIFILLGWSVHFVGLFCVRPFWTSNFHPLGMIRPLCGLFVTYPFIIKIHVENQSCIWIFFLKENAFVEKITCPLGLKKAQKDCSKNS